VLNEIGADTIARIMVFNKVDLADGPHSRLHSDNEIKISALKGEGIDDLVAMMAGFFAKLREEVTVTLPAARGDLIAAARRDGQVLSEEYHNGSVQVRALVTRSMAGRLRKASAQTRGR
jgi:50S ribosomal subunit-associated GTPase HflX